MNHFDEMTALMYLEGQLERDRANEVSVHAGECKACGELLRALQSEDLWLRQALTTDEESVPARLLEAPERGSTPWGWITAFGLSAAGAYTLWTGIVEPWRAQAAQAGFTQNNVLTMLFFSGAFWKGWDAMRNLMEFLAVGTLTIVVSWLLRRHWRRLTAFAAVMVFVLCALLSASSAGAAETRRGHPSFTLARSEEVHTDLFVLADRTEIDGDIDGDLVVWSREVIVNGHVKGDVICGAERLRINGTVDGNVRSFAQVLDVTGNVGKNIMSWSGETDIEDKATVGGTVTFGSNDASLSGKVAGDVLGMGHTIDVNGKLAGNATFRSETLSIASGGEIDGQARCACKNDPEVASGAKLAGRIERISPTRESESKYQRARFYWHRVLLWGVGFVFGLVLLLLVPSFYADATESCKRYVPAAGFGLLFLFAAPIAAFIACITIVGLGVGIATLLLYIIALYASTIFVAGWLGEALLGPRPGVGAAIGRLALGLFILHVLRILPYVGGWILFIVVFWGFGALMLAIYKHLRPQLATPAVA
jgi:cytoskeletal protein CcmA (bactofilin family)